MYTYSPKRVLMRWAQEVWKLTLTNSHIDTGLIRKCKESQLCKSTIKNFKILVTLM